ncbi:glycosyltransferase [Desulfobacter hydrogenophilus]|uniref:Glycosyltransferase n=1 Tax=Desulfobacter hydrogenophilus TaxID=2291 RepID=A0A328F9M2_9BACT|nr:glycosyltransferase [Desulfobacter hydrogenophilus]NDY72583.1 glycosyltransferase [Desulfobacter hydrogenophilus]QBH13305.1 glycosyltransferase [Desulfobacter hydrogenophilus]RAM01298.1 glycosyltransferase [Desulfobacter hydrogenophilus]
MTPATENPWAFFDRLYCISLRDRTDRRERARIEFSHMGIEMRVEFVLVDKDHNDPCRGIFASHLLCMKKAIDAGARQWVVFEDDVVFHRYDPHILKDAVTHLSNGSTWTLLFFGCLIKGSSKTGNPRVKRIRYQALAHAYAVNRAFGEKILSQPWCGVPYDTMLRELSDDYLGTTPFFAFQSNAKTDNEACLGLDRFRRCFGGLGLIQLMNEFFHAHRLWVILGHLAVLTGLGVCIW